MSLFTHSVAIACLCIAATQASSDPIYPNSIASNDLDFITDADPHVFRCLEYAGRDRREMPDKRTDDLFAEGTFVFTAHFDDGTRVGIWAHPDFASVDTARNHVERITTPLGKLPTMMRQNLSHVVLHKGDETAFGEDQGHFFVLYSDNVNTRIRNHDIQETVFHESVHATLDADWAQSPAWKRAQDKDGAFVTDYAADQPHREDMAESALFAYTILTHPGRLPNEVETRIKEIMPSRLAFFQTLFIEGGPVFQQIAQPVDCDS